MPGTEKWKLLPLPRGDAEALLLCFEEPSLHCTAVQQLQQQLQQLPGLHCSLHAVAAAHSTVADFLEPMTDSEARETLGIARQEPSVLPSVLLRLWLDTKTLSKPFAAGLSYVGPQDTRSFCFTGHYGKAGSLRLFIRHL